MQYREREENTYIVSDAPDNRYTLAQRNDKLGKVTESVVLLFVQNGQAYSKTVKVNIQGAQTEVSLEELRKACNITMPAPRMRIRSPIGWRLTWRRMRARTMFLPPQVRKTALSQRRWKTSVPAMPLTMSAWR